MDIEEQELSAPVVALLLIVGEPFSEDHKIDILAEITKGFRCWDAEDTGVDINEELAHIANRASLGTEGNNGDRLIQHQSERVAVEILINPVSQSVKTSIKQLLLASAPTKYIIYAGYAFQGSGAWVLQDDTFSFNHLAQVFKNTDVENALKQNIEANLTIHTLADSNWGTSISKADFTNNLRIQLNPSPKLHNIHGVLQFSAYVGGFLRVVPLASLLQASEQFGNISFTRPTLYIFPGCQGDSALFGVSGFNLLVNGGYNRRASFWDFARHLDRIDAALLTHIGTDNVFGFSTALQRKSIENIHPQIGYLYANVPEKFGEVSSSEGADDGSSKSSQLLINLVEEASKLTQLAKQLNISPHPCLRSATAANGEPVNLFHKLGHGSLDMYVLNPVTDSKELKELQQLFSKPKANLEAGSPFPVLNALSVCALLVWKPYKADEKIVRILFPGNAPQYKIIEGFEKLKHLGFLKQASCTSADLNKPQVKKVPAGPIKSTTTAGKGSTKASTLAKGDMSRSLTTRAESPRKEVRPAPAKAEAKAPSPTKPTPTKSVKEDKKREKETTKPSDKESKAKPSSAREDRAKKDAKQVSAPSPVKTTHSKSPSPPKSASPPKSPTKTRAPAASATKVQDSKSVDAAAPAQEAGLGDAITSNHLAEEAQQDNSVKGQSSVEGLQTLENSISEARDAVGAVDHESTSVVASPEQTKVAELSTFDEKPSADFINGETYENEEEEKPQALPEPLIIVKSPSLDSDSTPDYSAKIESAEQELSEFSKAEEEILELAEFSKAEEELLTLESKDEPNYDPAQEIPISPDAYQEEKDYQYQADAVVSSHSTFETPVFSSDVVDSVESNQSSEHKIQYGITESSSVRDMGGIQEVDEEEQEDEALNGRVSSGKQVASPGKGLKQAETQSDGDDADSLDGGLPEDTNDVTSPRLNGAGNAEHQSVDFDPLVDWGQPMGLPAPPENAEGKKSSARANGADKRPGTATARAAASDGKASRPASSAADGKKRPATAPATVGKGSSRSAPAPKRAATGRQTSVVKVLPLPPLTAFYVDLTYIPSHGDSAYCDAEFFKRVRARNYVISSLSPNPQVLDDLLEAKATWDQKDLEVTIIPTYDSEILRHWMGVNKEKLQEQRVDVAPAVSRCTVKLQDLETSLPAYRLEV